MKRTFLILPLQFLFSFTFTQNIDFTPADPQPDLVEIYSGSSDSGDIDGDGDNDLIMAGITPGKVTALYLNDGNGNFTELEGTPFPQSSSSVTIFEDLDGDGDLDLFFSGNGFNIQEFARVYLNDGLGNFTQLDNPDLPQFADSGVGLADVDGDGDKDLLIAVMTPNGELIAEVLLNDGAAIYTPIASNGITPVQFAAVAFIDVEDDGDADVLISGDREDGSPLTQLYLNDGAGNYSADNNVDFLQLAANDIDVGDVDNDGDFDILMSGTTVPFDVKTILYLNNGNGQFSELSSANLQQTFAGSNIIADLDMDGDQDIVVIGSQNGGLPNIYNIVYENLGNHEFLPVDTIGGEYIAASVVDDFNGDDLPDIIIQGFVENTTAYWNTTVLTSVDDLKTGSQLTLFPNPSSGRFTLSFANEVPAYHLEIFSMEGRLIYQECHVSNNRLEWELDLPVGVYMIVVRVGGRLLGRELLVIGYA